MSSEDVVLAEPKHGRLEFVRLVQLSNNSVYRVFVMDKADVQAAREEFRAIGCPSEASYVPGLFAMEVPGEVSTILVEELLDKGAARGRWEYEVGAFRRGVSA